MYYTTSGAYRKTKVFIDYANVFLTLCIGVLFVLILIMADMRNVLFPIIFYAGAMVNAGCAVKRLLDKQRIGAVVRLVITLALIGIATLSLLALF